MKKTLSALLLFLGLLYSAYILADWSAEWLSRLFP